MELVIIFTSQAGSYFFRDASSEKMAILAHFLISDVGYYSSSSFKEYVFNDWERYTNSNATALEKKDGYVFLSDLYSQEDVPTILKMTSDQFVKLLDEWQEKVCNREPKEAFIKYENDQYVFETKY